MGRKTVNTLSKFVLINDRNDDIDSDVNIWSEDGYCDTNALVKGTLGEILNRAVIDELHCQIVSKSQNLFDKVVMEIHEYLKTDPFRQFLQSMYYHRYLQWVWLERRPVNENNFFCYRLLGKGGFAEVCSVQSSNRCLKVLQN